VGTGKMIEGSGGGEGVVMVINGIYPMLES
jgi:hypothetical protein